MKTYVERLVQVGRVFELYRTVWWSSATCGGAGRT